MYMVTFVIDCCLNLIEISVSFSQSSYTVNENSGPLQPVLVLSSPLLCCSGSVLIKIDENTAKGINIQVCDMYMCIIYQALLLC